MPVTRSPIQKQPVEDQQRSARAASAKGVSLPAAPVAQLSSEESLQQNKSASAPFQLKPFQASGQPVVQRAIKFSRFETYGFLSNWGSYNAAENELLQLETTAIDAFANLNDEQKNLTKVKELRSELNGVRDMTLEETGYAAAKKLLQRIIAGLKPDKLNNYCLREFGRPLVPDQYDAATWKAITVSGMPKKVKNKIKRSGSHDHTASHLFSSFISQSWNYNIMDGVGLGLIGENYQDVRSGNCIALAQVFAQMLQAYNIKAEAKYVRTEDQGRFIAKVDNFIDPKVRGHIYYKNTLLQGYYIFSAHAAVWVESEGKYFDPMSKMTYGDASQLIECNLTENGNIFRPAGGLKTLPFKKGWSIKRTDIDCPGGFKRDNVRGK